MKPPSQQPMSAARTVSAVAVKTTSRDEMNLAEFPLTVLSTRVNPNVKTLEFSDTIYSRSGKPINRRWTITATDKYGLPTASDDEVLLGLLKLTVDKKFENRRVYFTRYELLRILNWSTEGRSYTRLQNALDRLAGVRIKASNAFYDNESKKHITQNFGIIDDYKIIDGRDADGNQSYFNWSEVLFSSFKTGFIKKLDLDFYLELRSAVSRRLYRYLDKNFWYRSKVTINLFTLAHEKIGISRNYKYPSSLRQQLDPAIDELVEQRFLAGCEYSGRGKKTEVTFFSKRAVPRSQQAIEQASQKSDDVGSKVIPFPDTRSALEQSASAPDSGVSGQSAQDSLIREVLEELVDRGIQSKQAMRLLEDKTTGQLERSKKVVAYFDTLIDSGSQLISRNPSGWLYSAIRRVDAFVLPGESAQVSLEIDAQRQQRRSEREGQQVLLSNKNRAEQQAYEQFRTRRIEAIRSNEVEPALLTELTRDTESRLENMKRLITAEKFHEVVRHAVDEKLTQMFLVPEIEEWRRTRDPKHP